ncbi:MAG: hypothetical protein K2G42_07045 [Clostridia bacterium]|nr:hypothetical protein [Clostridia bacterium]
MNYLFFDIECANCFGGHGKICSLGYVLADERLNILEQKDILVNPKSKFHTSRGDGEGIELGYDKSEFLKSPDFKATYPTFKKLLEDPDVIIFGHSVNNDINFLISECNRYEMPYFTFNAFDTQILHRHFMPESNENGLGKICEAFGISTENLHRSDYDAYLTLQVAKKMCEIKGADIQELLHECPNAYYSVENGNVKNNYATVSYTKKLSGYARFVKPDPRLLKHSKLMDKHFCFSTEFEKDRFKQALFLVNTIRRKGGVYSQKISKLNYFLPFGENCLRTKNVMGIADGHIAIVTEEQLLDILEIDKNLYEEVKAWSMGKIRNYGLPKPKKPSNSSRETTDNKTKKD